MSRSNDDRPWIVIRDRYRSASAIDRGSFCWVIARCRVLFRGPDGRFYDPDRGTPHYIGRNTQMLQLEFHPSGWRVAGTDYLLSTVVWPFRQ